MANATDERCVCPRCHTRPVDAGGWRYCPECVSILAADMQRQRRIQPDDLPDSEQLLFSKDDMRGHSYRLSRPNGTRPGLPTTGTCAISAERGASGLDSEPSEGDREASTCTKTGTV